MFSTLLLVAQLTMPDSAALATVGNVYQVPIAVMLSVAWMETRTGERTPRGPGVLSTTGHRVCREVGRMQINPCLHKSPMCKAALLVYRANLHCGALLLANNYTRYGSWEQAIKRYNGNGAKAEVYLTKALVYLGRRTLEGVL